jgi:1-aminocyclopropane-1-carboxylate deaminase/D-cysteine desulfhydrase-like pyridoxal-dependent ACC family enzyme
VSGGDPDKSVRAAGIMRETASMLEVELEVAPGDLETDHSQIGPGYGIATPGCLEAIVLTARTEGIVLDPVYTGKAMAGLIADIRARRIAPDATVVFLHTGGLPGVFAHAADLVDAETGTRIGDRPAGVGEP